MALSFVKLFQPQVLPAAVGVIYTMPTTPGSMVMKNGRILLSNFTAGAVTATLYAVPSGGSPTTTNMFLPPTSIATNGTLAVDIPTLAAGDSLQGLAGSAASINIQEEGGTLYS